VAVVASIAFIAMSVFVAKPGSNYRFSALFLVPIVWGPYVLRRRIHLRPVHDVLFTVALLLGPKNGMLKTEGVYEFDTQRDMFDNLMGAIVAVTLYAWSRRARRSGREADAPGPDRAEAPQNPDWRPAAPSIQSGP